MAWWEENLATASFAGVEFPLAERGVEGGRVSVRRKLPFVDGARHEDLGRDGVVWDLTIPLFRGVSEDHYPGTYRRLLELFSDGAVGEYVDPEQGTFTAKVTKWRWNTDPRKRDGGVFQVRIEESSEESAPFLRPSPTSPRLASSIARTSDEADAELADLGVSGDETLEAMDKAGFPADRGLSIEAGAVLTTVVGAAAAVLRVATGSSDEIAAIVDYTLGQIGAVMELDAVVGDDGVAALNALVDLAGAVRELGDAAMARAPSVVELEIPTGTVSAFELAATLYGTVERYAEVLDRAPTLCPLFYTAGAVVRLASR